MNRLRVSVVINPISGRLGNRPSEAERRRQFVRREAEAAGVSAEVHLTTGPGHATDLACACAATGCDVVIAMGGDGTVNEVARGIQGTTVPLGIVPCGSGDGFARGMGLPADWRAAFQVALHGETVSIDVGLANDRLFLNIAGIGFDAALARQFSTRKKRGALGYFLKGIPLVWTYRSQHYEVQCGDVHRAGRMFLVGFANAPEYGNGAVLSPTASIHDGLLDVVLVKAGSPLRQLWRGRRLFMNATAPAEGLERLQTAAAIVTGDPIVCQLDGEVFVTSSPLHVSVVPGAMRLRVPRRT